MMAIDRIWKFPLVRTDRQTISMPSIYSMLHVGFDPAGDICIWAAVDGAEDKCDVEIYIIGTGHLLPHVGDFIGTFNDGPFVWHVFTGPRYTSGAVPRLHYQTKDNGNGR